MKKLLFIIATLICSSFSFGQSNITQLEYYFDTDPGVGNATSITVTPSPIIDHSTNLDVTGLSGGLHVANIRALNDSGWSHTYSQPFVVIQATSTTNVTELEYFIDTDPGYGNATQLSLTSPGLNSIESFSVDLTGVAPGLHIFQVRTKDSNGEWSLNYVQPFLTTAVGNVIQIVNIEYFIDTDPGFGNGTQVSITTPSSNIEETIIIDLSATSPGFHIAYFRAQDSNGEWSLTSFKPFIMMGANSNTDITALEYHIDSVVGFGQGTTIPLNANNTIDTTVTVDLTGVAEGTHQLYVAALDANGTWSLMYNRIFCVGAHAEFASDTICVGNPSTIWNNSPSDTSGVSFFWDVDNDGNTDFNKKDTIQYTFPSIGSFPVSLVVDNDSLCPDTFTANVIVDSLGSISGDVFNGSGAVTAGFVKLYEVGSGVYQQYDSTGISPLGTYSFINVDPGQYVIKVNPDTAMYPNTVSTYFDSTFVWSNATTVNSFCDTVIDVGLLDISLVFGDGTVSGNVNWIDTTGQRAGDPIPGLDISLEQVPGGIIADHTQTDGNGYYEFTELPDGDYEIYVDIPGAPMDSTYHVTINSNDTLYTDLNFIFDSATIYIAPVTGTAIESADQLGYFSNVYPNPFTDQFNVELSFTGTRNVEIVVTDILGKPIKTIQKRKLQGGLQTIPITTNSSDFPSGVYFVNISAEGYSSNTIRIVTSL